MAWLAGALLLLLNGWTGIAILIGLYLVIFAFSIFGVRRPYFSIMSVEQLGTWIINRRPLMLPGTFFGIQSSNPGSGQSPAPDIWVRMVGQKQGSKTPQGVIPPSALQLRHLVRMWGISSGRTVHSGDAIQVWKLEFLEMDGKPTRHVISSPRLIPLFAGLFFPLVFWTLVRIAVWWLQAY
ncbi:MAG: hypothetical protein WCF84_14125 [Anaerolineae bacterium]